MAELLKEDLAWCVSRVPKRVREVMKERSSGTLVIGGGFIRSCIANEKINDVDLFLSYPSVDPSTILESLAISLARVPGYGVPNSPTKTKNAWTIRGNLPVQLITRWVFTSPEDVMDSFDFTICRATIWYDALKKAWQSKVDDRFYQDLAARRLDYASPKRNEDAGGSMLRVLKFYQRGYRIPIDSLGRVLSRMLSGIDDVNYQKRYMMDKETWEASLGLVMTGLLREVDPQVDPEHFYHLPAKEPTDDDAAD